MRTCLAIMILAVCPVVVAEGFPYSAHVLDVEDLGVPPERSIRCSKWQPGSLMALLSWDIDCQGASFIATPRYRVTYEVDGHQFVTMRDSHPGKVVEVKISARGS